MVGTMCEGGGASQCSVKSVASPSLQSVSWVQVRPSQQLIDQLAQLLCSSRASAGCRQRSAFLNSPVQPLHQRVVRCVGPAAGREGWGLSLACALRPQAWSCYSSTACQAAAVLQTAAPSALLQPSSQPFTHLPSSSSRSRSSRCTASHSWPCSTTPPGACAWCPVPTAAASAAAGPAGPAPPAPPPFSLPLPQAPPVNCSACSCCLRALISAASRRAASACSSACRTLGGGQQALGAGTAPRQSADASADGRGIHCMAAMAWREEFPESTSLHSACLECHTGR